MTPGAHDTMVVMPPPFYKLFADWAARHGVGTTPAYDLPWRLPPGAPRVHVLKLVPVVQPATLVGWTNHLAAELRKAIGCESRQAFGDLLDVSRNAVNKWEIAAGRGETKRLSDKTRTALNRVLADAPRDVQERFARYGVNQDAPSGG